MSQKAKTKFNIIAIIVIAIICISTAPIGLQNDTFYTVKIGEHIVENGGIDMQDPFSWHEGLKYTYPHWLYDTVMYLIYDLGGWNGIYISTIVLSCILGIAVYLTNVKICKNNLISFLLTIGVIFLCKPYIAARAQLITFILFVLTIYFIERFLESRKLKYAITLVGISILIANLHVAVWPFYFILYLPYIAEYIICAVIDADIILRIQIIWYKILYKLKKKNPEKQDNIAEKIKEIETKIPKIVKIRKEKRENPYKLRIERNKNIKYLVLIFLICALTGLCTPIGKTPYTYLIDTMNGITTENINEHLPLTLINSKDFLCIIIAIIALLMFTDIKVRLKDILFLGGLIILSLMSRRQISMFLLIGIYAVNRIICEFLAKYKVREEIEDIATFLTTKTGAFLFILIFMLLGIKNIKPKLDEQYISNSTYPVEACEYILNNIDLNKAKFYNEYNYGSYMLYKGIPVFIDSRADLYSPEFNEGVHVFEDFLNIANIGTYYEDKIEEYGITHLIMYKNAKLNMFVSRNDNYTKLYEDDSFVIYERNINE